MPEVSRWFDIALALIALFGVGGMSIAWASDGSGVVIAIVVVMSVLIALRRSWALGSAIGIYAVSLLQCFLVGEALPINLLVPFALYSVTAYGPRMAGLAGLAGGYIGAVLFAILMTSGEAWSLLLAGSPAALLVTMAWAIGLFVRARSERLAAMEQREAAIEAGRASDAELAVAAERARIAREMHDVVAHSLAVIIAQADGGRYAAKTSPETAERTLATISDIGRDALSDIRRILGVLRDAETDEPILRPQPTEEDLGELVQRVRDTGVHVSYAHVGEPKPLLPGMGLALQRVCQEALTNALKHAGEGARISVLLRWGESDVRLQVDDDGRGAAAIPDGTGSGLVGMRERAQLFGGTLNAGPRPTGGFRVAFTLPLHADHASWSRQPAEGEETPGEGSEGPRLPTEETK